MKNLKELVREQFHKMIDEHGAECAIETVKNDQSFLLSEYRPTAIADIIVLLTDRENTQAVNAIDNKLLDLFISVCDEYQKGL